MDKKISICFSTILGNLSIENENKSNANAYNKFFTNLYATKVPVSIHLTGSFLQMLQNKDQAFYDIIKELIKKKQIELIGGAYFSPLFPLLTSVDILSQIELHTTALRKLFSVRPRSVFLPFSAWNSSVVTALKKSGTADYCLLDNRLFSRHDLSPFSPICMEEAGKVITSVPYIEESKVSKAPKEFYDWLVEQKGLDHKSNTVVIFLPYNELSKVLTREQEGTPSWLDEFLEIASQNENIDVTTIVKSLKDEKIFPVSFIEPNIITEDGLQNASVKKLISQNEFAYQMYKKTIYVSALINQARGDKQRKLAASKYLWKAQNAMFFLKGALQPLENRNLIFDFYRNILLAEKTARNSKFADSLVDFDFNLNGVEDYISQTKNLNTYVDSIGGKIVEYDFLPANKNYAALPFADAALFVDYFASADELKNIFDKQPKACLRNVLYQTVKCTILKKTLQLKASYTLDKNQLGIKKNFTFNGDFISVQYIVKNEGNDALAIFFVCALDIALGKSGNTIPSLTVYAQNEKAECGIESLEVSNLTWIQLNDAEGKSKIVITPNESVDLKLLPICDKAAAVIGAKVYLYWQLSLPANGEAEKLITIQIERIKR